MSYAIDAVRLETLCKARMQNGSFLMGNSLAIFSKVKGRCLLGSCNSAPRYILKRSFKLYFIEVFRVLYLRLLHIEHIIPREQFCSYFRVVLCIYAYLSVSNLVSLIWWSPVGSLFLKTTKLHSLWLNGIPHIFLTCWLLRRVTQRSYWEYFCSVPLCWSVCAFTHSIGGLSKTAIQWNIPSVFPNWGMSEQTLVVVSTHNETLFGGHR